MKKHIIKFRQINQNHTIRNIKINNRIIKLISKINQKSWFEFYKSSKWFIQSPDNHIISQNCNCMFVFVVTWLWLQYKFLAYRWIPDVHVSMVTPYIWIDLQNLSIIIYTGQLLTGHLNVFSSEFSRKYLT